MQNLFKQTKTKSKYSFHVQNYLEFANRFALSIEVIAKGILSNAELTVNFNPSKVNDPI